MFMKQYKQELFLRRDTRQYRVKVWQCRHQAAGPGHTTLRDSISTRQQAMVTTVVSRNYPTTGASAPVLPAPRGAEERPLEPRHSLHLEEWPPELWTSEFGAHIHLEEPSSKHSTLPVTEGAFKGVKDPSCTNWQKRNSRRTGSTWTKWRKRQIDSKVRIYSTTQREIEYHQKPVVLQQQDLNIWTSQHR